MDTNSMSGSSSGYLAMLLAAVVPATLLAGCADGDYPDATHYSEEAVDFSGEQILRVEVQERSFVEYLVETHDDITELDICFLKAGQLEEWRDNHSVGLECQDGVTPTGRLSLEPGKYLIAMECREGQGYPGPEVCHVSVTVKMRPA